MHQVRPAAVAAAGVFGFLVARALVYGIGTTIYWVASGVPSSGPTPTPRRWHCRGRGVLPVFSWTPLSRSQSESSWPFGVFRSEAICGWRRLSAAEQSLRHWGCARGGVQVAIRLGNLATPPGVGSGGLYNLTPIDLQPIYLVMSALSLTVVHLPLVVLAAVLLGFGSAATGPRHPSAAFSTRSERLADPDCYFAGFAAKLDLWCAPRQVPGLRLNGVVTQLSSNKGLFVVYAIVRAGGGQEKVEVGTIVVLDRSPPTGRHHRAHSCAVASTATPSPTTPRRSRRSTVKAEVVGDERGPKIVIHKFKGQTGYKKRQGHRADLTRVRSPRIK